MGCNTSQETPAPVEGDNAEINKVNKEAKQEKEDTKPESAKTVTLTSNGIVLSGTESRSENKEDSKLQDPSGASDLTEDRDLEEAAVKIQAAFRGHKTRQNMKQPGKQEESEPTLQELEEEFRPDDVELCHAATKIQASFRGHMTRKQMEKKEDDTDSPKETKNEEEELDIDLSDPELNKAAVKIQASFRGHMTRKNEDEEASKTK